MDTEHRDLINKMSDRLSKMFEGEYAIITLKKSGKQLRIIGNNNNPGVAENIKSGHNPNRYHSRYIRQQMVDGEWENIGYWLSWTELIEKLLEYK